MAFIKLTRPNEQADRGKETAIRTDHILQMSPCNKPPVVTWLLIMHTGWFPAMETVDEIIERVNTAEKGV